MMMNRILCAATLAASGLVGGSAHAQTRWDMATPYPETEHHTINIRAFAKDVADATGGKLEIVVHSGQSLFRHPEIKRAVQTGQVPLGEILGANLVNEDPIFGVDAIPFLATSIDASWKLYQAQKPFLEAIFQRQGLRLLYAVAWPSQGFFTKAPISKADDLKGVKFRTYNAPTARMAELMGAVPTIVEAVEIPQAFSTGIVDAMVTSAATGVRTKAWDFSRHFYDMQAWLPKNLIIVNERALRALDESQRNAVLEAAAKAETRGWEMLRKVAVDSLVQLQDGGMEVHKPDPALLGALQKVGETMTREWTEQSGADGAKLIEAYSAQ